MRLLTALSYLLLAKLLTGGDGNPLRATPGDVTTTLELDENWNISSLRVNASSIAPPQHTGTFPTLVESLTEHTDTHSEPFTLPGIRPETSDALTLSDEEDVSEGTILIICQSIVDVSNASADWCAKYEDGFPEGGNSFTSSAIDVVEGNGTSATKEGWVWSSITWTPWVIIQMLVAIFGIIGNAFVIVVLYQHRAANRFTDTLIANLAAADLLTSLFVIPLPMARQVPNTWEGQIYCKVVLSSALMWANMSVSTYLLIAISIERYIAIVHPVYFAMILSRRRVKCIILLIWVLNYLITATFSYFIVNSHAGRCTMIFSTDYISILVGTALFVYRVFFPSLVMVIPQVLIVRKLYRQATWFRSKTHVMATEDNIHLAARSRVIQLMLIVILVYVFCWTPVQFAFLLYTLSVIPSWYPYSIYHRILTLIGFFNSCANPIIYTLRHAQFRQAIMDIFKRAVTRGNSLFGSRPSPQETTKRSR